MSIKRLGILFTIVVVNVWSVMGQVTALPKKQVGQSEYYYYEVKKKETIYGISKALGVSKDYIEKYNPSIREGLKTGQILLLPVEESTTAASQATNSPKTKVANALAKSSNVTTSEITHRVERGETIYGISKLYGIEQSELIAANPEIADGLKAGQEISIPQAKTAKIVEQVEAKPSEESEMIYHKILPGETLYSVAKRYNTSIDEICQLNPGVSTPAFRATDVVRIKTNTMHPIVEEKSRLEFQQYKVGANETFETIAQNRGVDVTELQAANPTTETLKKGKSINVPVEVKETVTVSAEEQLERQQAQVKPSELATNDKVKVAVILPFMLRSSNPSTQAKLYTEFFKGFLLAADTLRNKRQHHLAIYTYDNEDSDQETARILQKPGMRDMSLIIAPPSESQLTAVNKFGEDNKVAVLNPFSVRHDDYSNNGTTLQVNIPSSYLLAEVEEYFDKKFRNRTVLTLDHPSVEHKDIYDNIIDHVKANKYEMLEVSVGIGFNSDQLEAKLTPGKRYVIVPSTGSRDFLQKFMPALKRIKQERIDVDICRLGYPEYISYMSDFRDSFCKVDTYMYSRFFYNPDNDKVKRFERNYQRAYGEEMRYVVPRMGMLGLDCGMSMLTVLDKQNLTDCGKVIPKYVGLQNTLQLERVSNWSGFINKSMNLIHFTPQGTIKEE